MGLSLYDERSPWSASLVLDDSHGTDPQMFATSSGSSARIDTLLVVSASATDQMLELQFNGLGSCPLGRYTVPAGAGMTPEVPPFNLLASIVSVGVVELVLPQMGYFEVSLSDALAPGETLTLVALGGNV
jgi:hypothetical protein